jgi:hypothetical protein
MLRLTFSVTFFCVFSLILNLHAQVVNIENKRFLNDTNDWIGNTDFNFNVFNNTQQVLQFSNTIRVQYQKNRSRFIILNDANFIKAGQTNFANSGFQHLRYNYKLFKRLTVESFIQTQYNPVLKLNFRYLIGVGPRLKLLKKENAKIYIASLYLYEYDDIMNETTNLHEHRISSYVTFTFSFFKTVDITSTTFYQPNIENSLDYRIANDTGLEIHVNKHVNFKTTFNMLYDSRQPIGIPDLIYTFKNGFSLKF